MAAAHYSTTGGDSYMIHINDFLKVKDIDIQFANFIGLVEDMLYTSDGKPSGCKLSFKCICDTCGTIVTREYTYTLDELECTKYSYNMGPHPPPNRLKGYI